MGTDAHFSPDRRYRYWLTRTWDDSLPLLCTIGLNPSTADETTNDATIRKDIGFATRLGFGGVLKLNIGAFRATDPKNWRTAHDPFGEENAPEDLIDYLARFRPGKIVACWGKSGGTLGRERGFRIAALFAAEPGEAFDLWCFGKNSDGTPRHTLMLPYSTKLEPFGKGEA